MKPANVAPFVAASFKQLNHFDTCDRASGVLGHISDGQEVPFSIEEGSRVEISDPTVFRDRALDRGLSFDLTGEI